jgi:hypothetical protein
MISKLLIHSVILTRLIKQSQNTLGEPTYSASSYAYASSAPGLTLNEIPCRVEEYNMIVEYRQSAERIKNSTIVYIPATYLPMVRDEVFWGTNVRSGVTKGDYIGIITGIQAALKGSSNVLDHWECTVENP